MKAFLISPNHQTQGADLTVVEVEQNADGDARLQHVCELLECNYVQTFEPLPGTCLAGHTLIVDEDGPSMHPAGFLFMPRIYPTPLACKILVLARCETADGEIMASATALEADIRALISCAYCSPAFAKAAMTLHEDSIRRNFPDVIVVPGSQSIQPYR